MSELHPIANHLCNAIDAAAESLPLIAPEIDKAASAATKALLNDGKIIACGSGFSSVIAQLLTTSLLHQHEFARPGLPAINLSNDTSTISAIAANPESGAAFTKQVRALSGEHDCLFAINVEEEDAGLNQAVEAAKERGTTAVIITTSNTRGAGLMNAGSSVVINLETKSTSNAIELATFTVNAIVRSIESKLFGAPL